MHGSVTTSVRPTLRLHAAEPVHMAKAALILRTGGLVAIPTETVYGLAANALNPTAVASIFTAKQRPAWDPLIVHIVTPASDHGTMLQSVVSAMPPSARRLIAAFWPGPLTLLLPRNAALPLTVTAARELVGVRAPAHPVAQTLLAQTGLPLAAPSANRFGHISPSTATHVLDDLDGRIDAVLDGGPCSIGVESTVYDPAARILYRQGSVSQKDIEVCVGHKVNLYQPALTAEAPPRESLPSPGVGIRHYAPRARLILVEDHSSLIAMQTELDPRTTAIILPTDWPAPAACKQLVLWAAWNDYPALAAHLYAVLRQADAPGIQIILCPYPRDAYDPLELAIRDRLQKAALTL